MSERKQSRSQSHPSIGGRGGPAQIVPGEKPKEFKKTLKRLAVYLRPRTFQLVLVTIAGLFSTVFAIISPKLLGDATTSLFASFMSETGVDFPFIQRILLILLGLYFASSLFAWIQQYIMAGVSQRTIAEMRRDVNEKLARLPLKYYDRNPHGDILSRAVNDIDNIANSFQQALTQIITSVITIIGIVVMMLVLSPLLTVVVVLTVPLSAVAVRYIGVRSQKYFVSQQTELGVINGHIEEMFTGHQAVKAYGHEPDAIAKFADINERLYESGWKAQFITGLMFPVMGFISNLGYVFVSIIGGIFVLNGSMPLGNVQAFIQYTQQLSHPMGQAAGMANLVQAALASAERIFALLDEEEEAEERPGDVEVESLRGHVTFENVHFGYDEEVPVINDVSMEIKEGQTVALVGPTGAGKTTIINLLMRFYEADSGRLLIDDVPFSELSREKVRSCFAMVLQDTWLFSGTIRDNIAYGREGATEEEIVAAAKSAFADDFIRTLPDGYDTVLGEDASNISQGQRQLLTIARAIISNPLILILDEATSSVDTRTEMNIQKAMHNMLEGRTSFVIAHRLSTIRDADLILVINEGDIIEQGTHDELLQQGGFYAELYHSQFSDVVAS